MGLFLKKEKASNEELVDRLLGSGIRNSDNLYEVLSFSNSKNQIQNIVKKA